MRSRAKDIDKTFKIFDPVLQEDFSLRDITSFESVLLKQEPVIVFDQLPKNEGVKYLMVVDGKQYFQSLGQAGASYDCGWMPVEIGDLVLLADWSTRPMNDHDRDEIRDAADEYSGSK